MYEQIPQDYLTGFFSREALGPFLERLAFESTSTKKRFSVALIDLDHFKRFNDKFGHACGDEVLKYATSTIRLTFQGTQCHLFRYGGDEFIAVFPQKDTTEVFHLLRTCAYNLHHRPFLFKNNLYKITFSCGIIGFPNDESKLERLIQRADEAMYFSKSHGRNLVTLAGRIKYLRLRNIFVITASICVIFLSILMSYKFVFKDKFKSVFQKIESVKFITTPTKLDMIILKNGQIFEGRIVEETEDLVILSLYLERGEGQTVFKKTEISKIKYATEPQF